MRKFCIGFTFIIIATVMSLGFIGSSIELGVNLFFLIIIIIFGLEGVNLVVKGSIEIKKNIKTKKYGVECYGIVREIKETGLYVEERAEYKALLQIINPTTNQIEDIEEVVGFNSNKYPIDSYVLCKYYEGDINLERIVSEKELPVNVKANLLPIESSTNYESNSDDNYSINTNTNINIEEKNQQVLLGVLNKFFGIIKVFIFLTILLTLLVPAITLLVNLRVTNINTIATYITWGILIVGAAMSMIAITKRNQQDDNSLGNKILLVVGIIFISLFIYIYFFAKISIYNEYKKDIIKIEENEFHSFYNYTKYDEQVFCSVKVKNVNEENVGKTSYISVMYYDEIPEEYIKEYEEKLLDEGYELTTINSATGYIKKNGNNESYQYVVINNSSITYGVKE